MNLILNHISEYQFVMYDQLAVDGAEGKKFSQGRGRERIREIWYWPPHEICTYTHSEESTLIT